MVKIIALTNAGGMIVGAEYEVGANVASTLITSKRARLASDKVEEEIKETPIKKRKQK
jgi:hypothetical protein